MKTLIFIFLVVTASCKKEPLPQLTGNWAHVEQVREGTMTTTITFAPQMRYAISSYVLSPDRRSITQTCTLYGDYTDKLAFKADGQTFYWIASGKLQPGILLLKDKIHNKTLTFIKTK